MILKSLNNNLDILLVVMAALVNHRMQEQPKLKGLGVKISIELKIILIVKQVVECVVYYKRFIIFD